MKNKYTLEEVMTPDIRRMLILATAEHNNQTRRDGKTPYIDHLVAVAERVIKYGGTESMVIVALGHDLIEDTEQTVRSLTAGFGEGIGESIGRLSNNKFIQSTFHTKGHYLLAKMKPMEAKDLLVKICDLMCNTEDLVDQDQNFASKNIEKARIIIDGLFELVQAYGKTEEAKELSLFDAFMDLMVTVDNVQEQCELKWALEDKQ